MVAAGADVLAVRPEHGLVEVDHRARDQLGGVAEQVGHHRGDVVGPQQASQRPARVGLGEPGFGLAGGGLHAVLALGRGPADVEPVDPDPVGLQLVAGVAREDGQRALGRRVAGQHRLAAVAGHRDDVDDAAAAAGPAHQPRRLLDEDERRAGVDREQPVPELDRRVVERPATAQTRRVDQPVEAVRARAHDRATPLRVGEVRGDEDGVELRGDGLPALAVAAGDDQRRAERGGAARDRRAEPLRGAGDDDHAVVEPLVGERVHQTFTGWPSRSERNAASPIASGARASTAPTGGVAPVATAPMNASHSRR